MTYTPLVDDYVKWIDSLGRVTEGWVYFASEYYITIEIGVKCKDDENIADCPIHKKTHTLVVCYPQYWEELQYIKNRRDPIDSTPIGIESYKSQEGRYVDIQ